MLEKALENTRTAKETNNGSSNKSNQRSHLRQNDQVEIILFGAHYEKIWLFRECSHAGKDGRKRKRRRLESVPLMMGAPMEEGLS